ncbi:MAG: hypothetical protein PVJ67_01955 [Candidatus Pacearchaeota archaeon]|jgi:hypothetical protein
MDLKKQLKKEETAELNRRRKKEKDILRKERNRCIENWIEDIKEYSFDPFKDNDQTIIKSIYKNKISSGDDNELQIRFTNTTNCYQRDMDNWEYFFPRVKHMFPAKGEGIATNKINPKRLREFLSKIEDRLEIDIEWAIGHDSYTSYTLQTIITEGLYGHCTYNKKIGKR